MTGAAIASDLASSARRSPKVTPRLQRTNHPNFLAMPQRWLVDAVRDGELTASMEL